MAIAAAARMRVRIARLYGGGARGQCRVAMTASFLMFDDARIGGAPCRLYQAPVGEVVAQSPGDVPAALAQLRAAVANGKHVAGWIGYDAGYALEAKHRPLARKLGDTPLLWFGLFDDYRILDPEERAALLGNPAAAWIGRPRPRIERADYLAAADTGARASVRGRFLPGEPDLRLRCRAVRPAARRLCPDAGAVERRLGRGRAAPGRLAAEPEPRAILHAQGRHARSQADEGYRAAPRRSRRRSCRGGKARRRPQAARGKSR